MICAFIVDNQKKGNKMEEIVADNGIRLLKCKPLNWKIQHTYADGTGPIYYSIHVGDMAEMWSCIYNPDDKILSIAKMAYSSDDVLRFKVNEIERASEMVKSLGDGIGHDFSNTIYVLEA